MRYRQEFKVLNFECDPWRRMTPGSVLRRGQEIATDHCTSIGLDQKVYEQTRTAFLLSRVSLLVNRMPEIGETITMETRPYAMEKAVYTRITSFYGLGGETLCETDSRWVLVNTETRRILRRTPEFFPDPFEDTPAEGHDFGHPKFCQPAPVKTLVADYSLCDSNFHVNNTRYADMVCDLLPPRLLGRHPLKRMLLHFRSEIPLGTEFELLRQDENELAFYALARQNGAKSFECYAQLA